MNKVNIQIASHFTSIEDLDFQIEIRKKLLEEMVGQLWPPIVRGEIIDLRMQKEKMERICENNKEYLLKKWNKL